VEAAFPAWALAALPLQAVETAARGAVLEQAALPQARAEALPPGLAAAVVLAQAVRA
jgi:hypothetical protein